MRSSRGMCNRCYSASKRQEETESEKKKVAELAKQIASYHPTSAEIAEMRAQIKAAKGTSKEKQASRIAAALDIYEKTRSRSRPRMFFSDKKGIRHPIRKSPSYDPKKAGERTKKKANPARKRRRLLPRDSKGRFVKRPRSAKKRKA